MRCMHVLADARSTRAGLLAEADLELAAPLSRLPVPAPRSDIKPDWTRRRHLTGTKWAMSNDREHPAHWLIVLNNEHGSPL